VEGFKLQKKAKMASKVYSIEEAFRSLEKDLKTFSQETQKKAKQSVQIVAAQAHGMIVQKASKLKSTRKMYLENLNIMNIDSSENNEVWAVVLYQPAKFLEDGQPRHNMLDYLTKGPKAKTSKDGHKYAVIPFEHSKPSSQTSLAQQKIANYVKSELKKRGLDKTVMNGDKPAVGRVATLNLTGKGSPYSKFNKPLLHGVTVYQKVVTSKSGKQTVKRDTFTFRVASEKQRGSGLWDHPGRQGLNAFDETAKELDTIWDNLITQIVNEG